MANLQKYFEKFHENIRTDYDMSSTLRDKRDIILKEFGNTYRKTICLVLLKCSKVALQ